MTNQTAELRHVHLVIFADTCSQVVNDLYGCVVHLCHKKAGASLAVIEQMAERVAEKSARQVGSDGEGQPHFEFNMTMDAHIHLRSEVLSQGVDSRGSVQYASTHACIVSIIIILFTRCMKSATS